MKIPRKINQTLPLHRWMHFKKSLIFGLSVALGTAAFAGYTRPSNFGSLPRRDFRNESGVDSSRLNRLMNQLRDSDNGGVITLKSSSQEYQLGRITIRDNFHIRLEPGVKIRQSVNGAVFNLRGKNCSIVGSRSGRRPEFHTLGFGPDFRFYAVLAGDGADNFLVEGFDVFERETRFPAISSAGSAKNGLFRSVSMVGDGATGGWGAFQMQGGVNIDLRGISGLGGFTCRLEQNDVGTRYDDITGRNITCKYGRGALALIPNQRNGSVDFSQIRSEGCGWGASISGNGSDRTFSSGRVSGVVSIYDATRAQFRAFRRDRTVDFVPGPLKSNIRQIPTNDSVSFSNGPTLGTCLISDDSRIRVERASNQRFPWPLYRYRNAQGQRVGQPAVIRGALFQTIADQRQ